MADDSTFVRHLPCPECGSSDANSLFSDGHTYCFSCGAHGSGEGADNPRPRTRMAQMIEGDVQQLVSRKITQETCDKFNYRVGKYKGKTVQIAPYYDAEGQMVAQKLRFADKTFMVAGEMAEALPFGAQCWQKTGKQVVVTEGEIDAMSMSQVQGNKWPVVSIGCGAGPQIRKYFAKHQAYFAGFEKVVLMFDMDEKGREAAKVAAEVIGSRARIAELTEGFKDASDVLVAGKADILVDAMWRAKEHRPEGIVDMADLKEKVKERPQWGLSWHFDWLTNLTYGIRLGEIYALGAGTGIGKTDFFAQLIKHLVMEHKRAVGVFSLEQAPSETAVRIAGKVSGKTFHIPDSGWTDTDLDNAWDQLMSAGRVFLYDSFGNNDWQIIKEKIEYLAHAEGVQFFFLDHLTALAAWQEDERKELEVLMSEMGELVKKLNVSVFFVSHLATPEGRPHEEGGRVMIRHFKGSRSIGQWSHYMFGLERDQSEPGSPTVLRCLKDRYTGRGTGQTVLISYDPETGLLHEREGITLPSPEAKDHGFGDETPAAASTSSPDF